MRNVLLNLLAIGIIAFATIECGCAASRSLAAITMPRPQLALVVPENTAEAAAEPTHILDCGRRLEAARVERRECVAAAAARCQDERQVEAAERSACMRGALANCSARHDHVVAGFDCRYDTRFAAR